MPSVHAITLRLSATAARWSGTPVALAAAGMFAAGSVIYGARIGFSEEWALTFDIVTALVPFLMLFVLQSSQNRDGLALQAKLDELILQSEGLNRMVGAENLEEPDLRRLVDRIQREAEEMGTEPADEVGSSAGTG